MGAECTERVGLKWISPSHTPSSPDASAASARSSVSWNAAVSLVPGRRSSRKIPKCMAATMPYASVAGGPLFVDAAPAGVRIADQQGWAKTPAAGARQHRVEERVLSAAGAVRDVHHAEDERQRGRDLDHDPPPGLARPALKTRPAEGPARGDEQGVAAGPPTLRRRHLVPKARRGQRGHQRAAGRRDPKLRKADDVRVPARELPPDGADAPPATRPDVPRHDAHQRDPLNW